MKLIISPRAEKQLKKLSKVSQIIVVRKIRSMEVSRKMINQEFLRGYKNIYRVRVGDFRIVYRKRSSEVYVISIGHRRDIYKKLKKILG